MLDLSKRQPGFSYAAGSAQPSEHFLETLKTCHSVRVVAWSDKRINEAGVTHKVSVECFREDGRRIEGQKLFKFGSRESQFAFCDWLDSFRSDIEYRSE